MSRPIAVLRPELGSAATVARLQAVGLEAIALPLFATQPLAWTPPARPFDGLLLTSAAAVRHAGPGLAAFGHLPVLAVGKATAAVAREAGLAVGLTGERDAADLVGRAGAAGYTALLHLGAREGRVALGGIVAAALAIYASEPLPIAPDAIGVLAGTVALVHSPRAGARLAKLAAPRLRASIRVAAISPAAAKAAGTGWAEVAAAEQPTDAVLIALARALAG